MKQLVLSFLMLAGAFQAQPALALPHDMFIPQGTEVEFAELSPADQLSLITRYAGMGYNLLQANPEGDFYLGGVDPGIKTTRFVFDLTYDQGLEVYHMGESLNLPDQVSFHSSDSCASTYTSTAYSGQKSYQDELSVNVDASGGYDGALFSFGFALSYGMQTVEETTKNTKKIVVQSTKICNYGRVSYNLDNAKQGVSGYTLTETFKNAVRNLPSSYDAMEYTQFIDSWGTHILETVTVGSREIIRKQATYTEAYSYLMTENEAGVSVSGSYGGGSGSVSVDLSILSSSVSETSEVGESLTEFTIGSEAVPLPIKTETVFITEALSYNSLWSSEEWPAVSQKKTDLERALQEYPENKAARIGEDPLIVIDAPWPDGRYSLIQATSGCPTGWSSGFVKQDFVNNAFNVVFRYSWLHRDYESLKARYFAQHGIVLREIQEYLRFEFDPNSIVADVVTTYYCTKTIKGATGYQWPGGHYCIARYGGSCPDGFFKGSITWDDENSNNKNRKHSPYPDGNYGSTNTKIHFCCRSDGSADHEIYLPPTQPFALYRYVWWKMSKCQRNECD